MQTNKQTIATGNCNNLDTNLYSGCGYIAPNGANVNTNAQANYTWVKIKNSTLLLDSPGTPQYDPTPQYNP
jgi:hypothetical protein